MVMDCKDDVVHLLELKIIQIMLYLNIMQIVYSKSNIYKHAKTVRKLLYIIFYSRSTGLQPANGSPEYPSLQEHIG
jgi:hypothetical protein